VLFAWPASAYIAIYRQRLSVAANFASQLIKIAGAYAVRQSPTAHLAVAITAIVTTPAALAKIVKPKFREALGIVGTFLRGAPFQTLYLASTAAGGFLTYAIYLAGGDTLLSHSYLLFQISKSVYPALAIVPLMYGSLLIERDKIRRALLDGAVLLYLYVLTASIMAKTPEWYIALLRPAELNNEELAEAVRLNAALLLASGIYLHIDTTLRGVEEKEVFTLRDRPSKALLLDISLAPFTILLTYALAKSFGTPGMVAALIPPHILAIMYRMKLLGQYSKTLAVRLYIPLAAALLATYLTPIPLIQYSTASLIEAVITYLPNLAVLALTATIYTLTLTPPAREAATALIKKIARQL
jgi:hypothetical protein